MVSQQMTTASAAATDGILMSRVHATRHNKNAQYVQHQIDSFVLPRMRICNRNVYKQIPRELSTFLCQRHAMFVHEYL